jgi:hypothetical protein
VVLDLLFLNKKYKDKTIKKAFSSYDFAYVKRYTAYKLKVIKDNATIAPIFPPNLSAIFTINGNVNAPKNSEVNRPTYKLDPKIS